MEEFHLKHSTPVESLSIKRIRRTVKRQSGCDSDSEIRAASLGCHTHVATITTTNETTNLTILSSLGTLADVTHLKFSLPLPLQLPQALLLTRSSSAFIHTRTNLWNCVHLRHNLTCTLMTMLFLISIVLSGNSALAAQRESFKHKDGNNINSNANAIFNEISSSSAGSINAGNGGGGGAFSNSNSNNMIHKTTTSLTTSNTSSGYATTSSAHTTSSSSSSHKTSSSNRNSLETQETTQSGPYFDKGASKNVTALLGKTAYLNCRVKNLGNKTMLLQVSWVRHRDIHLLTVGRYTYTSDQRFRAIHQPQTEDWILQIKYPQHRDSGIYECQVSTTPHMSHYIHLNVVEPSTEIIGAPDLYIESGSTINLTCVILNSPEPPAYIFWNHNNAIINYDSPRGGISVVTNKGETTTSFLLIKSARPSDSGHYQCNPSNAKPKIVTVHVLNGEIPAAMQRAALAHHRMSPSHYILVYLLMHLFTLAYVKRCTRPTAIVHRLKSVVM